MDLISNVTNAAKAAGIETSTEAVAFTLGFVKARATADESKNTSMMIVPRFTIIDESKARPIMAEFAAKTKTEAGCLYYGWSLDGTQLVCEETYLDAAAVAAHLKNVGPLIGQLTAKDVATLDSIAVHGPAAEVEKCKPALDPLNAAYFITDGSCTNMKGVVSKITRRDLTVCSIRPYFTVLDWDKARPIMADFVQRTSAEEGMVYYGWDVNGDTLHCRECYLNGDAVLAHLANVGKLIGAILAEGVAKLDKIAIHGPAAELKKVMPQTKDLGTKYYTTQLGFQQFA